MYYIQLKKESKIHLSYRKRNNQMDSKISIITVTFNCETVIEKTLLSIIKQNYPCKEIIIIDGKSTDNTLDIIKKYKDNINVIISEKDKGIFDAMNKGIKYATGDWIIFMNAGDHFTSESVLVNISDLLTDSECGVIFGPHFLHFNASERLIDDKPFFEQNSKYRNMGFSHQSCLVRKKLAEKYKFDADFRLSADYKMIWNLYYDEKVKFLKSKYPISVMDDNSGETISNYKRHLIEECEICGFKSSVYRSFFIQMKYIEFRLKRFVKRMIL